MNWLQPTKPFQRECESFLFFELGKVFAPFGRIYSLPVYERLMQIPNAVGAKHSSLQRMPEWERLELRNRVRPDFKVFTGNDLAIDMVMYGSDYLLGLSTFAPDAFARRDAMWESGDPRFYELNDVLAVLGLLYLSQSRSRLQAFRSDVLETARNVVHEPYLSRFATAAGQRFGSVARHRE